MNRTPTFLYPHARDYAFDEVCEQIVRALERRHFDVPDIEVEFDVYGSGEQTMRMVRHITGQEFSLHFGRVQMLLPDGIYNDTAAVRTIAIPEAQLNVYDDNSGPTYYVYVGDDWGRDRERFFHASCFVNSKLYGEPRMYLCYKGSDEANRHVRYGYCRGSGYKETAKYLLHTNDLGRQYDLEDADSPFYRMSDVIDRMTLHLKRALEQIEKTSEKEGVYQFEEEINVPIEGCPEFWTYVENKDVERIRTGQSNVEELPLARRFALGVGYRLLALGVSTDGIDIDRELLHNGYVWCSLNPEEIPRQSRSFSMGNNLVRIKPTRANNIYVVDEGAYERCRAELADKLEENRMCFTDAEVNEMGRARAKTMIPWTEYKGDFENPVILIGREIDFDEVQIIGIDAR